MTHRNPGSKRIRTIGESIEWNILGIPNQLKREYHRLIQEKEKAETDGDPLLLEQAEKKFDEFFDYYSEYFSRGGRIKKFKQKESKVVKDRIAVNIKRALERIKKSSDTIWQHFNSSIAPPYSTELYYRPIKEIGWRDDGPSERSKSVTVG